MVAEGGGVVTAAGMVLGQAAPTASSWLSAKDVTNCDKHAWVEVLVASIPEL